MQCACIFHDRLQTVGYTNPAEIARILDVAMNPGKFLSPSIWLQTMGGLAFLPSSFCNPCAIPASLLQGTFPLGLVGFRAQLPPGCSLHDFAKGVATAAWVQMSMFAEYRSGKRATNASARPLGVKEDMEPVVNYLLSKNISKGDVMK
eukprot:scaffold72352_cov18-Tisochrysis_lutea.AAC.1